MSTTTTTHVASASPTSIAYLNDLFSERYDGTLDASHYQGKSQRFVSDMIETLLATDGNKLPSDESLARLSELSAQVGIQVEVGTTQAAVNRQVKWFEYRAAAQQFNSFLDTLAAAPVEPSEDDIPF